MARIRIKIPKNGEDKMAKKKKSVVSRQQTAGNGAGDTALDMERQVAGLKNRIAESLSGLSNLAQGLNGFNGTLDRAARLVLEIASDGTVLVDNLAGISESVKRMKNIRTAGLSDEGGAAAGEAAGGAAKGGMSMAGAILGGLGAAASVASGIFSLFRRRREEERKYRREMKAALNDQITAEVELSMATARRLADEQAITREKYKQVEAGIESTSARRQTILSQMDADLQAVQQKLGGRYSAAYKRNASNYYEALSELKKHRDDLDWLESVGGSPLIAGSDREAMERYQSFYERLLAIAQQQQRWKEQQKQLADDLIGSSAQSLADSWVEAFSRGEEATWDFAENFESVMRQAIVNGFSDTLILSQINPIFDKFREKVMGYLSGELELDQVVTPDLEQQVAQTAEKIRQLSPQLREVLEKLGLEVDATSSQTLSAAIRGVSEQTASLVAGQMNAIRTNQVKTMDTLSHSLAALVSIEANTRYNRYLESIDRRLGAAVSGGSALRAAGLS